MPYDIDNPPEKLRKLSDKKQRQWVEVWNSTFDKTNDESKAFSTAWGVVKKSSVDYTRYLIITPSASTGEYYRLDIPVGVEPPAEGTRMVLNGISVVTLRPESPSDIAAGRGGTVAKSMEASGIAYLVNCLPEGHKWLRARTAALAWGVVKKASRVLESVARDIAKDEPKLAAAILEVVEL